MDAQGDFYIRRSGGLAPKFASEICVGAPNFASKNIGDYSVTNSGALWQGSSTENWATSLKLSRMTAGYFIDTKFGMVTHTVNSNLKPLLFLRKSRGYQFRG